jgi:glycosyltransferase involved in cell wall biosynthesis
MRWLSPNGYHPTDLTYRPRELEATYFEYPAIPVLTRPVNGLICEHYLLPHVRATRPDLIMNYWLYPEGFGAVRVGRTLGVPTIVGAIGSDVRCIGDAYSRHLVRRTVMEAAGVITVSEDLRQRTIALGAPPERVTTILNGCDGDIFRPGDRDGARRELGVDPSSEIVLYVGHLLATKGLGELMEAFAALAASRPKLRLVIIGDGAYTESLKARVVESGLEERVSMPGRLDSATVASWMRACDLFCLPSYSEGCPNAVVEALSCGRPIVATDVGGIPELVKESCGILVPARDAARLRAALDAGLSKAWDSGRIAATSRRDWEKVAEETFAVCEKALASARKLP